MINNNLNNNHKNIRLNNSNFDADSFLRDRYISDVDKTKKMLNEPHNKWLKMFLDNKPWDYNEFLKSNPINNLPNTIANKIKKYVVGKGIKIDSEKKELTDYLNWFWQKDKLYYKLQQLVQDASLFGDCVLFLVPIKDPKTKDYKWSFATTPLYINNQVSTINYDEQEMVIYAFLENSNNPPLSKISITKKMFKLETYGDRNTIMTMGERSEATLKFKSKFEFKWELDVLPAYIYRNKIFSKPSYYQNNIITQAQTSDVCDVGKEIYLLQLLKLNTQKELTNNRTRLIGNFNSGEYDKIMQEFGNLADVDTMFNSSTNNSNAYNTNPQGSIVPVPATLNLNNYAEFEIHLKKSICNSANVDYEDFGDTNYQNKTNSMQARSLTNETIEYKRQVLIDGLYILFDIFLSLSEIIPNNKSSIINNTTREYTIKMLDIHWGEQVERTDNIIKRIENGIMSRVEARMILDGDNKAEAEQKDKDTQQEITTSMENQTDIINKQENKDNGNKF